MEKIPYHKTQKYAEQYGVQDGNIHYESEVMEDGHIHHHVDTELAELQAKGMYAKDNYVN